MYHSTMLNSRTYPERAPAVGFTLALILYFTGVSVATPSVHRTDWLPDAATNFRYQWSGQLCDGCRLIEPRFAWRKMQHLAGLTDVRFVVSPDESLGSAYTLPPNILVVSNSTLGLPRCQLNFVIGHELVHLAQRHYDEDAATAATLSGRNPSWTKSGDRAMTLLEDNFVMALRMSDIWRAQEREADWVGVMLSAEATGCTVEDGGQAYLKRSDGHGGGLAASHDLTIDRLHLLAGFASMADRLRLSRSGFYH